MHQAVAAEDDVRRGYRVPRQIAVQKDSGWTAGEALVARDDLANHIDADVALDSVGEGGGPVEITARRIDEHSSVQRPEQRDEIGQKIGGARQG